MHVSDKGVPSQLLTGVISLLVIEYFAPPLPATLAECTAAPVESQDRRMYAISFGKIITTNDNN